MSGAQDDLQSFQRTNNRSASSSSKPPLVVYELYLRLFNCIPSINVPAMNVLITIWLSDMMSFNLPLNVFSSDSLSNSSSAMAYVELDVATANSDASSWTE